jgi:spore maturation protein CgeB
LVRLIREKKPQVVFALRGDLIDVSILEDLKSKNHFQLWQWIYDPLSVTPQCLLLSEICDRLFHYSHSDTLRLRQRYPGKEVIFLPGAFDDRHHLPADRPDHHCDLFFCGCLNLKHYRYRLAYFEELLQMNEKAETLMNISVNYRPSNLDLIKVYRYKTTLRSDYPRVYKSLNLKVYDRIQLARAYQVARACLNLHDLNREGIGISPRTFELIGSGACIISDLHPDFARCFSDRELPFCIANDAATAFEAAFRLRADSAYRKMLIERSLEVRDQHTYYQRFKALSQLWS